MILDEKNFEQSRSITSQVSTHSDTRRLNRARKGRGSAIERKERKKKKEQRNRGGGKKESRCPFRRPIHNWPHVCNEQLAGRRRSECTCGTMNSDPSDRQRNGYTQGGEGGVARYPTEGGGMCSTFWVHFPRGRQRTTSHSSLSSTEDILSTDIDTVRAIVVEP